MGTLRWGWALGAGLTVFVAGCGESAEVKAAHAAKAAETARVARITKSIEARLEHKCDNLLKAAYMADAGTAMGSALGQPELMRSSQDLKEAADRKYKECEAERKNAVAAGVAAVVRWGQKKQEILASAREMAAKKDWRALKRLHDEYAVNEDPDLAPVLVQARTLEQAYDQEWKANEDLRQFAMRSRRLRDVEVLALHALAVSRQERTPAALQENAAGYVRCRTLAQEVQRLELAERQKGELPTMRAIPAIYTDQLEQCAREAKLLCDHASASADCAAVGAEAVWPDGPQVAPLDQAIWTRCEENATCNDVFSVADAYCVAYVESVRNLNANAMEYVVKALALQQRAASPTTRQALDQMSLVGRQVGGRVGATMWRSNADAGVVWKACDELLRTHPVVHRLLPGLAGKQE